MFCLEQAYKFDISKKTQEQKNSKLKEKTQNSRKNSKLAVKTQKVVTFRIPGCRKSVQKSLNCKHTVHEVKYFSANGGAGGDSPSKKRRGQESQYPAPNTPVTSPNGPAAAAPFSVISPSRIPTIHNKKSSLDSSSHVGGLSERPRKNSLDNELSSGLVTTNSILFC